MLIKINIKYWSKFIFLGFRCGSKSLTIFFFFFFFLGEKKKRKKGHSEVNNRVIIEDPGVSLLFFFFFFILFPFPIVAITSPFFTSSNKHDKVCSGSYENYFSRLLF